MATLLVLSLIGLFIFLIYYWLHSNYTYWKNKNVPHHSTYNVIFGNITDAIIMKKSLGEIYKDLYNEFKDYLYIGFYKIRTAGILLRDPDLIRKIITSDFNSFHDNDVKVDDKHDPAFARNAFALEGERWKVVRNQITPCFTSGKMKALFPIMQEVSNRFVKYIEEQSKLAGDDGIETKELCVKYTTEDVVGCGFGLEANCFTGNKSIYREMGYKIFNYSLITEIKALLLFILPSLSRFLHIKFVTDDVTNYFRNLVKEIFQLRQEKNIKRNDFINNLIEIKAKDPNFTIEDMMAHSLGLFTDGFETSSIAMSFVFYEMACNPQVQSDLQKEVDDLVAKGNVTYEAIQELPYLEAVVCETLRMHPPIIALAKKCTLDYNLPPYKEGGQPVSITAGTPIVIPILALHFDAKYHPDPDKFDPGRFLGQRKSEMVKCSYMPFGKGSRQCLGQRFATTQTKVGVFNVVANFDIRVSKKTKRPLQINPIYLQLAVKGGIWLKYYKRKKE